MPDSSDHSSDPLEILLITSVPDGYAKQPDSILDTGPSDMAKMVKDDPSPDAEAVLTKDGFVHGYQRLWENGEHYRIIVSIYQFAGVAGATAYHDYMVAGLRSQASDTLKEFSIPAIPAVVGLQVHSTIGTRASVSFAKNLYVVQIGLIGRSTPNVEMLAKQLAEAQYMRF